MSGRATPRYNAPVSWDTLPAGHVFKGERAHDASVSMHIGGA